MRWAALALLPLLAGCASVGTPTCPAGQERREVVQMFFGRNIGHELGVSDADFAKFLDAEVSSRFPDGFTVQEGQGRWLYEGVVYNEPSKVLSVILPGKPDDQKKVGEIAAAYEDRFRQDAVLSMAAPACVSFWLPKDRASQVR